MSQNDAAVVDSIAAMLTAEEAVIGLKQPSGIGQRPKQVK